MAKVTLFVSPRLGVKATALILFVWHRLFGFVPDRLLKALFSFKVRQ